MSGAVQSWAAATAENYRSEPAFFRFICELTVKLERSLNSANRSDALDEGQKNVCTA